MPFDPATLKYDAAGLIPCVAQDHASGEVLMVAWMNAASVAATLETWSTPHPTRVINATGVLLHTNLGRAPWSQAAIDAAAAAANEEGVS